MKFLIPINKYERIIRCLNSRKYSKIWGIKTVFFHYYDNSTRLLIRKDGTTTK